MAFTFANSALVYACMHGYSPDRVDPVESMSFPNIPKYIETREEKWPVEVKEITNQSDELCPCMFTSF